LLDAGSAEAAGEAPPLPWTPDRPFAAAPPRLPLRRARSPLSSACRARRTR